ncbi:unnamed protein product [Acanthoscelides obtectus]|uniref:Uncharacterized protein n=1 Tax=Acanthoscelides obtectus TaxID=200917 RepID=A0A9P0P5V0_ACAOB|nr:unnamed protein product [Acanthoscelides obtectus]CAK1677190.1 hypothetical protein AOBTE_LOCUS31173 [Acanthoscelides obtectus]
MSVLPPPSLSLPGNVMIILDGALFLTYVLHELKPGRPQPQMNDSRGTKDILQQERPLDTWHFPFEWAGVLLRAL